MFIRETKSISNQIVTLTTTISYKFALANDSERVVLTAALTILSQAQTIMDSNPTGAQKLYNNAYRLSTMVKKGVKNETKSKDTLNVRKTR